MRILKTQFYCIDATDPLHHLSLTFCWASHLPQHIENSTCCQNCIQSQICSFDFFDVIWDCGVVAHVAVTTTLPVPDCLWLEKVKHTPKKIPLLPAWQLCHRKAVQPPFTFSRFTHTCGKHDKGKALIPDCHNVHLQQNWKTQPNRLTSQGLSLNRLARSETKPTNHVSFRLHAIPGTTCPRLRGTSMPPSRKRRFCRRSLEDTEEPLSDRHELSSATSATPTKAHAFTASTGMLGPAQTEPAPWTDSQFRHTGQCQELRRIITISVSARNFARFVWGAFISVAWIFGGVFSSPSVLAHEFGAGEDDCPYCLWTRHCFQWLIHDWNYTSLLSDIVHLFSIESILQPSY